VCIYKYIYIVENCLAKCLNGGACVNGKCICTKKFDGEFCENDLTETSNIGWWILILLFLAALGVGGYLLFMRNKDNWTSSNSKKEGLNDNFVEKNAKPLSVGE